jgi:hypothetical protein
MCGLKCKLMIRARDGKPFQTDAGNIIIDATIGKIPEPTKLSNLLKLIPGVVDHGLFIGMCGKVLLGTSNGVKELNRPPQQTNPAMSVAAIQSAAQATAFSSSASSSAANGSSASASVATSAAKETPKKAAAKKLAPAKKATAAKKAK